MTTRQPSAQPMPRASPPPPRLQTRRLRALLPAMAPPPPKPAKPPPPPTPPKGAPAWQGTICRSMRRRRWRRHRPPPVLRAQWPARRGSDFRRATLRCSLTGRPRASATSSSYLSPTHPPSQVAAVTLEPRVASATASSSTPLPACLSLYASVFTHPMRLRSPPEAASA